MPKFVWPRTKNPFLTFITIQFAIVFCLGIIPMLILKHYGNNNDRKNTRVYYGENISVEENYYNSNEKLEGLWALSGNVLLKTSEGNIVVFDPNGEVIGRMFAPNSGIVVNGNRFALLVDKQLYYYDISGAMVLKQPYATSKLSIEEGEQKLITNNVIFSIEKTDSIQRLIRADDDKESVILELDRSN